MVKNTVPKKRKRDRTKSWLKRAFYTVFLLAALVGAGYYTGLQYLKSDAGRAQVVKQIEKATGREVEMGGLDLAPGLKPTVKINGLRIDNAEWGKADDFLTAKEVLVTAELLPMLEKKIILQKISLVEPNINLEKNKQGTGNWEFAKKEGEKDKKPDEEAAKKSAISLNHVSALQTSLTYLDMATGKKHNLKLAEFTIDETLTALQLKMVGQYQQKPLTVDMKTATVNTLMAGGEVPLDGKIAYAGNDITLKGKATIPNQELPLAYNANVSGRLVSIPADVAKVPEKYKGFFPVTLNIDANGNANKATLKNVVIKANGASLKTSTINIAMDPVSAKGTLTATLTNAGLFVPQLEGKPLNLTTGLDLKDKTLRLTNLTAESTGLSAKTKGMTVGLSPVTAKGSLVASVDNMGLFIEALKDKKLAINTDLDFRDNKISTENMTASLGKNTVTGNTSVRFKPDPMAINFNLKADDIYLADLKPQTNQDKKPETEEKPKPKNTSGKVFPTEDIDLSVLNTVNLNGSARIGSLHLEAKDTAKNVYKNISLATDINNGKARLKSFNVDLPGGAKVAGSGSIAQSGAASVDLLIDEMQLGDFLQHWTGNTLVKGGRTVSRVKLTANGKSVAALAASANGSAEIVVKDAAVQSGYIDLLADDLVQNIIPFARKATGLTKMNCIVSRWPINNGVATTDITLIDTQQITIAGNGNINLGKETLDVRLIPSPKKASLVSLSAPILVRGTFSKPKFRPDTTKVATDVLKAAALGAINPLAIALPYLSAGGDKDPCDNVLDGMAINLNKPKASDVEKALTPEGENAVPTTLEGTLEKVTPELLQQDPKQTLRNLEDSGKNALEGLEDGVKGLFKQP